MHAQRLINLFATSCVLSLGVGRANCDTISLGQGQGPLAAKMMEQVRWIEFCCCQKKF